MVTIPLAESVWEALEQVRDPEIPVISLVDLGIIRDVRVIEGNIEVDMIPTFAGCPALDVMSADIRKTLSPLTTGEVRVNILYTEPWSSNFITLKGKELLKDFGFSPPPAFDGMLTLDVLQHAICPRCGSNDTTLINAFGPTACRAVHHCRNCLETFQQFKPL